MTNEMCYRTLRVNPRYRSYIVERDEVVVLYHSKRPLILPGREVVSLFRLLDGSRSTVDLVYELQDVLPPEVSIPYLRQLIQQDIIEIGDEPDR